MRNQLKRLMNNQECKILREEIKCLEEMKKDLTMRECEAKIEIASLTDKLALSSQRVTSLKTEIDELQTALREQVFNRTSKR